MQGYTWNLCLISYRSMDGCCRSCFLEIEKCLREYFAVGPTHREREKDIIPPLRPEEGEAKKTAFLLSDFSNQRYIPT